MNESTNPSSAEVVEVLLNCKEITDATRLGVGKALDAARQNGRDYPTVEDCIAGAVESGAIIGAIAGAWGFVRNRDNLSKWHNARFTYTNPDRDDERVGVFQCQQSLLAFMAWAMFTGSPIPFQFEFASRSRPKTARR
jgi:hypothetical protein